jgi:hypothetical protein
MDQTCGPYFKKRLLEFIRPGMLVQEYAILYQEQLTAILLNL